MGKVYIVELAFEVKGKEAKLCETVAVLSF